MEKERYMLFDHEKGVLLPLKQTEQKISTREVDEKAEKIQLLLKNLIKQTVRETVRECDLQIKEELRDYEQLQDKRWAEMEEHFRSLDETIREKQIAGKRKKHSIF
ncbi:MAG: hypothetical protein ACI4VG_00695 [Lachnospiraceae bacterium]